MDAGKIVKRVSKGVGKVASGAKAKAAPKRSPSAGGAPKNPAPKAKGTTTGGTKGTNRAKRLAKPS